MLLAGYRHYASRLALGVGIELDAWLRRDPSLLAAYSYPNQNGPAASAAEPDAGPRAPSPVRMSHPPRASQRRPWVATAGHGEETAAVSAVYREWTATDGRVPEVLRALSLHPEAMSATSGFVRRVSSGATPLGERREVAVALAVGELCECPSLQALFRERWRRLEGSAWTSAADAARDEADRALLAHAALLTVHPERASQRDVDRLRGAGFADPAILDATVAIAFWNGLARIANALGAPADGTADGAAD